MNKKELKSGLINYFSKIEVIISISTFLMIWAAIYQVPFGGTRYVPGEQSLPLSFFISLFPTGVISAMLVFFITSRTSQWLKPMMKLVVVIAKADGKMTQKEKKIIEKNLNKDYGYFRYKKAIKYFNEFEKREELDIVEPCRQLHSIFYAKEMAVFISFLVSIAVADQYLSQKEEELLNRIGEMLRISPQKLASILERRKFISEAEHKNARKKIGANTTANRNYNKAYKILGLPQNSSLEEAKKAYRELVKTYHPDKVRDKKLKENAKKQFQEISEAYEIIKKEKG